MGSSRTDLLDTQFGQAFNFKKSTRGGAQVLVRYKKRHGPLQIFPRPFPWAELQPRTLGNDPRNSHTDSGLHRSQLLVIREKILGEFGSLWKWLLLLCCGFYFVSRLTFLLRDLIVFARFNFCFVCFVVLFFFFCCACFVFTMTYPTRLPSNYL